MRRAELTDRYGVAFTEIVKGQAEIAGVPGELLEQFSKRTAEVDQAMVVKGAEFYAREGRDPSRFECAALGREAAVDTRARKTGNGVSDFSDMSRPRLAAPEGRAVTDLNFREHSLYVASLCPFRARWRPGHT